MSYYTKVEFTFADKPPDFELDLGRARSYLEAQGDKYPVDFVLDQFRICLKKEKGDFKGLYSDDIEGLMNSVSAGFPGLIFFVRGQGEEFPDVWLRLFRDGKVIFRAGPFEKQLDTALEET
jgi:hypothetical protein